MLKGHFTVSLFIALCASLTCLPSLVSASQNYIPNEILVKFKSEGDSALKQKMRGKNNMRMKRKMTSTRVEHWQLPQGYSVEQAIEELEQSGEVVYAEPNYRIQRRVTATDPNQALSWALGNTGQTVPSKDQNDKLIKVTGVVGEDLNLQKAWDLTTGSKDVVIAIHDDSLDLDHPDLQNNIWVNANETPNDGIDNDNNGYIDDINGWDVRGNDNNPNGEGQDGHGTLVAGAAGAVANNDQGITGAAWNVSLMGIRTDGDTAQAIAGFEYALAAKPDIIVASWGGPEPSKAMAESVAQLEKAGILLVVAAGNDGMNNDYITDYPSGYPNSNVISVSAFTAEGKPATWAHKGQTSVDITAPGEGVYLTVDPNSEEYEEYGTDIEGNPPGKGSLYAYTDGTSYSAPYAAGVAALLKTHIANIDHKEIKARLVAGTRPFADNWEHLSAANGKLDAEAALTVAPSPVLVVNTITPQDSAKHTKSHLANGETYQLAVKLENLWQQASNVNAVLSSPDSFVNISRTTASYNTVNANSLAEPDTPFTFNLTEAPNNKPVRFELKLTADGGYSTTRRFVLENIATQKYGVSLGLLASGIKDDDVTNSPIDGSTLTLPDNYRFVAGETFTISDIRSGSLQNIAWQLSQVPDNSKFYLCNGNNCTTAINASEKTHTHTYRFDITEGSTQDSDGNEDGSLSVRIVMLQSCGESGTSCTVSGSSASSNGTDNSSSSGGGSLPWFIVLLLSFGYLRRRAR